MHDLDEYGDHDSEACYECLKDTEVQSDCRCGKCCRLLVDVRMEDAEREPRIREVGSPFLSDPDERGNREVIGYMLNSQANDGACAFLDLEKNLCSIHPTRPLVCRLFDCGGEGREQLIELGMLER